MTQGKSTFALHYTLSNTRLYQHIKLTPNQQTLNELQALMDRWHRFLPRDPRAPALSTKPRKGSC